MKKYKDKNWLKKKYLIEKLSIPKIASLCDANFGTIYYFLKKFQIETRHELRIGNGNEPWNKNLKGIYSQETLDRIANKVSQAWKDGRLGNWQKNQPKTFKKCVVCGKEFRISPSKIEQVKCCSMKCRKIWMSKIMKGENGKNGVYKGPLPMKKCKNCGKIFQIRKHCEIKTNNFCSKKCYIKWYRGPNHKQWTGESTLRRTLYHQKENLEWRKANFEKNNYTCQKCRARNGEGRTISLRAHHIKNWKDYPELRYEISNGITLCKECHRLFHRIYGFRYNNEIQLNEFLGINICIEQFQNSLILIN